MLQGLLCLGKPHSEGGMGSSCIPWLSSSQSSPGNASLKVLRVTWPDLLPSRALFIPHGASQKGWRGWKTSPALRSAPQGQDLMQVLRPSLQIPSISASSAPACPSEPEMFGIFKVTLLPVEKPPLREPPPALDPAKKVDLEKECSRVK